MRPSALPPTVAAACRDTGPHLCANQAVSRVYAVAETRRDNLIYALSPTSVLILRMASSAAALFVFAASARS